MRRMVIFEVTRERFRLANDPFQGAGSEVLNRQRKNRNREFNWRIRELIWRIREFG